MEKSIWDVLIVGAGAAGLMAAITAKREGARALLLDGKEKIGAKILMSGGTRCNLTNQKIMDRDFNSQNQRALRHVLQGFSSESAVEFFKELGVDVVLEPGGKYFPSTHSAKTVLDALIRKANRLGVEIHTARKVNEIRFEENLFQVCGNNFSYRSQTVILSTGGLSHPATGSDGTGYGIARLFGHHLVSTTPALTPLLTEDLDWKSLAGVSLPVRLVLWVDKQKQISYEGSFLFTHFGFSGPAALNISRHWIHWKNAGADIRLTADFLPEETDEDFRKLFADTAEKFPSRSIKNFLGSRFPDRFAEVFLKKAGISESMILNQLKREERETLIRMLFHFPLPVTDVYGYEKAEVTAGGVDLSEIDTRTMESKMRPGLFLAGEILDADGRIGGFNFQWSWSSGFLAGCGAAKKAGEIERLTYEHRT